MKKLFVMMILVLSLPIMAVAETPYQSLDKNNFYEVARALRNPEWLANFCFYELSYVSDKKKYDEEDYWPTPEEVFTDKEEDCDGWNILQKEVLQINGYSPEIWVTRGYNKDNKPEAHAICVFFDKGKWNYMQSAKTRPWIFRKGFSSKEEAVKSIYGEKTTEFMDEEEYRESEKGRSGFVFSSFVPPYQGPNFSSGERLSLHNHLTEASQIATATGNRVEIFIPAYPETKAYAESIHKEAVGYLHPIKSSLFKDPKIGFSISAHGYYSSCWETHDLMYSLHLVFSRMGFTGYGGDFHGINIDINPINSKFLKYYVCFRNGTEVIDHKIKITTLWDYLDIIGEKRDKDLVYSTRLKLNKWIGIGIGERFFSIETNPFSLNYSYDSEEETWYSSVRIRF